MEEKMLMRENSSLKMALGGSILLFFFGIFFVLLGSDIRSGVSFFFFAVICILTFYSRLAQIPGYGYEKYKEALEVFSGIVVLLYLILLYAIQPLEYYLVCICIFACGLYGFVIYKIYKKHFSEVPERTQ